MTVSDFRLRRPIRRGVLRLRLAALALAALGATLLGAGPAHAGEPEWAAVASTFLPGTGQFINGDNGEGMLHLGTYLYLTDQYLAYTARSDYLSPTQQVDSRNFFVKVNDTTWKAELYGTFLTDLSFYSAFAAYRDGRNARGNAGYSTPAPQETATQIALAPYRWEYLSRPTTFLPLAAALYFALTPANDQRYLYKPDHTITRNTLRNGIFLQSESVAIGEESFFRGFLNNGFSDVFGPYWGLAASSAVFGLAHEGIGSQATALEATLFGLYVGWVQQRNDYDIREGVAIHFWWDFLVSLGMLKHRANKTDEVPLLSLNLRF